jgi:hypothetical protein
MFPSRYRCPTDAGAAIMVDTDGQTLSRIPHPITGTEVSSALLPIYAFKFKSTGNVAFNCQVKICKEGEEDQCRPVSTSFVMTVLTNFGRQNDSRHYLIL